MSDLLRKERDMDRDFEGYQGRPRLKLWRSTIILKIAHADLRRLRRIELKSLSKNCAGADVEKDG